tara:strand:- start:398 stop:1093 length:696 start_codon:yes stop_codon:yes gene_type:complete
MVKISSTQESDISVIIRTRNEERWIGHCIQSILDFINKPEIIIIDNNSKDSTVEIINHFIQDPYLNGGNKNYTDIKIYKIENYTPGKSLNLGVKKAKKKFILIISAHCSLKKFDEKKLKKITKSNLGIFGNQIPIWNGKKINKRYLWSNFKNKSEINMFSNQENRYFFHNALSFFKRDALLKNPFNEILAGKEDRYWANNIVKKKKSFYYSTDFEVEHYYTDNGNTWKGLG